MSKLSCEAQALVHAVRGVLRPSDADRERVLYALRASLGERLVETETASSQALVTKH